MRLLVELSSVLWEKCYSESETEESIVFSTIFPNYQSILCSSFNYIVLTIEISTKLSEEKKSLEIVG